MRHRPEERYVHRVEGDGFWIDRHEATNAQFRKFVDAIGYGLHDMIGNVWELTNDWYRPGHSRSGAVNPSGPELASL